jgi:hypothetical protein
VWGNVPKLEVLAALQRQLALGLALDTFQAQDNLLRGLRLLVEDGLGLTTVTALLAVVTALTLGEEGSLAGLVLGDLVLGVLAALLAFAVRVAGLGNVDLVRSGQPMFVPVFINRMPGALLDRWFGNGAVRNRVGEVVVFS